MSAQVVLEIRVPFWGTYRLERLRFGSGRPHLVVVAGLHGNELTSIHAVNLLASCLRAQPPRGTVDLYPAVNTFGIDEGRKRGPFQDEDLNRSFPGDPAGTAVERIAHALLEETDADYCIDVHAGSPRVHEIPQVRVSLSGPEVELARATGLPLVWKRTAVHLDATGLVGAWRARGRKALRIMGGGGGTLHKADAERMANGLRNLMAWLDMGPGVEAGGTVAEVTREQMTHHRSSSGGFFVPEVSVGDRVEPGHLLGWVGAPVGGETLEEVYADRSGVVVTVRSYPVVHARELLVRVADRTGAGAAIEH